MALLYNTFDARIRNITAQLLENARELQSNPPAHTVIVERFQLGIRLQKCRLPAQALSVIRSFHEGGIPRVRLSFCIGRKMQLRMAARQWELLQRAMLTVPAPPSGHHRAANAFLGETSSLKQEQLGSSVASSCEQEVNSEESCPPLTASEACSHQKSEEGAHKRKPSFKRNPSFTARLLSSTLFRAASMVLTDYASSLDAELQAVFLVRHLCIQLNYLPHRAKDETGLLVRAARR